MGTKLYLGCGPGYPHDQHIKVMGKDWKTEWTFVDLYVSPEEVPTSNFRQYNAQNLYEFSDETIDEIYSSHFLEHVSHLEVKNTLLNWHRKLKPEGKITLNVPDLEWVAREIVKYENGQLLTSSYFQDFWGDRGLISVLYGSHSHDGEYHKSGFTKRCLDELLVDVGFRNVNVSKEFEGHDMGCLISTAIK